MGDSMDIKDLYVRYGALNAKRVSKNQKIRFLSTLATDFKNLGFEKSKIYKKKYKQKESYISVIGDLDKSKYLISTYYDTPSISFIGDIYEPFNDDKLKKLSKINYLIPIIVSIFLFVMYVYYLLTPTINDNLFTFKDILVLIGVFILMSIIVRIANYSGIPKKNNLVRNTSSILAMYKIAEKLNDYDRKKVAFAFVDFGTVDYFGYEILKGLISDHKHEVILLDSVGAGNIKISNDKSEVLKNDFIDPLFVYGDKKEPLKNSLEFGVKIATETIIETISN